MKNFRIGLLGHGTVGGAVEKLILKRSERLYELTGLRPQISGILTRSRGDFNEILKNSDVIVETIGGLEPARTYTLQALMAGVPLVTANKQLLCKHGSELFALARTNDLPLRFEASVAGAVPVVRALENSLEAVNITSIRGIVNGTTNYILTRMEEGLEYSTALAEAQELGYAETDPEPDVSGSDAAAKVAILARLVFGAEVTLKDVDYEGIQNLHADDLEYAREFDLRLKLLGVAERVEDGISLSVKPTFVPLSHPLASISGSMNAITIEGEAFRMLTFSGPGAGGLETASAILADIVSVMRSEHQSIPAVSTLPIKDVNHALHLKISNRPGSSPLSLPLLRPFAGSALKQGVGAPGDKTNLHASALVALTTGAAFGSAIRPGEFSDRHKPESHMPDKDLVAVMKQHSFAQNIAIDSNAV
jgi:homoserine dehydrogenase